VHELSGSSELGDNEANSERAIEENGNRGDEEGNEFERRRTRCVEVGGRCYALP
jgi:hypothetical protein